MKWKKTEQGYLVTTVQITRVGSFEYYGHELGFTGADANKKFFIHRTEKELFSPETIASFEGQTLTLLHPDEGEVSSKTWKGKTIGHIQNGRREGDHLVYDAYIKDAAAIEVIEELGLREVSCGWEPAELVQVGDEIHHINMRGNHVSVVPDGRGGWTCRLKDKKGKSMKFTLANIISLMKGKRTGDTAGQPLTEEELTGIIEGLEATLKELEGKDDPEAAKKAQEVITQLTELKAELEKAKPKPTDAGPEGGSGDASVLKEENTQLKTKIEELEAENKSLKEELNKLKGDNDTSATLNDAKSRFPKLNLSDAKSGRDVRERVLVGIGAFNDSAVKALTDEQIQAAYAAAQVSATPKQSGIGKSLLSDGKPTEKHDFTKQFGGK